MLCIFESSTLTTQCIPSEIRFFITVYSMFPLVKEFCQLVHLSKWWRNIKCPLFVFWFSHGHKSNNIKCIFCRSISLHISCSVVQLSAQHADITLVMCELYKSSCQWTFTTVQLSSNQTQTTTRNVYNRDTYVHIYNIAVIISNDTQFSLMNTAA